VARKWAVLTTAGARICESRQRQPFALGKTFMGWDHAWKIAARCAHLLGA